MIYRECHVGVWHTCLITPYNPLLLLQFSSYTMSWLSFLILLKQKRILQEWILKLWRSRFDDARLARAVLPPTQLPFVLLIVLLLQLAHLFYLVQVDDKAGLLVVQIADAFAAENGRVLRAIEMFDALVVRLAKIRSQLSLITLILLVYVKVRLQTLLKVDRGK